MDIYTLNKTVLRADVPILRPGMTVRVHQKIKELVEEKGKGAKHMKAKKTQGEVKERIQVFEGIIIAFKHGRGINGTITVRKISNGVGVERIFPLHAPLIAKIEVVKRANVRRAKLYYLRTSKKGLTEWKPTAREGKTPVVPH